MNSNSDEIKRMLKAGHSQEKILDLMIRRYELQGDAVENFKVIIRHIAEGI
jgi:cytochrome c-type biogenesis protein CcmH/NrfF